jgi:hypothetical protein
MLALNSSYSFGLRFLLVSLRSETEMLMVVEKLGFQGGLEDLPSLCQRCSAEIQEISVTKPFCESGFFGMMWKYERIIERLPRQSRIGGENHVLG